MTTVMDVLEDSLKKEKYVKVLDASIDELDKEKVEKCIEYKGVGGAEGELSFEVTLFETQGQLMQDVVVEFHAKWICDTPNVLIDSKVIIEVVGETENASITLYKLETRGGVLV